jgi:hypothetical protein
MYDRRVHIKIYEELYAHTFMTFIGQMRFSAAQNEQKKSLEVDLDVDDDEIPKGLSSALSSSRIPGISALVTKKKRVKNGVGFVRTNRTIEKQYLRLTTFPKADDVRPLEVLKMSLKHIKEQYIKNEDFDWANEQLKSVRQDITVQGLRTMFVLEVYETHARILLEYGDLNEFNQCQTMIRTLTTGMGSSIDDGLGKDIELSYDVDGSPKLLAQLDDQEDEFAGYRLLYALIQNADISKSLIQTRLTIEKKSKDQSSQKLSSCLHAMNVIRAVIHSDYRQFFRLYNAAPHLSSFLMDFLVKRIRDSAYERILASYRPTIGVEEIRASLNFQDLKETKKFLKQNGAVFIKEKDEPRIWVDCKASRKLSS